MKVLAINGGPRKNWNTAILLKSALDGAAAKGAQTELVHLYDLNYKGCTSCFSCKLKGGKSYGKCAIKDGLTPVLEKAEQCDAIIMGSPVYISEVTGELRSFLERFIFQYLAYDKEHTSLFKKKIKTGFIYTMGVREEVKDKIGYEQHFKLVEGTTARIFGSAESLYVTDTLQFDDYSKYVSDLFDPNAKAQRRCEVFPQDLKKAFEMGERFAQK